jgi:hypothetical protein
LDLFFANKGDICLKQVFGSCCYSTAKLVPSSSHDKTQARRIFATKPSEEIFPGAFFSRYVAALFR